MHPYHTTKYWTALAKDIPRQTVKHGDILYLANLVLQDPAGWWTKRAVKNTVCLLIADNPPVCAHQLLSTGRDASPDLAWRGLLHDRRIMKCFRSRLPAPTYQKLLALAHALKVRLKKR